MDRSVLSRLMVNIARVRRHKLSRAFHAWHCEAQQLSKLLTRRQTAVRLLAAVSSASTRHALVQAFQRWREVCVCLTLQRQRVVTVLAERCSGRLAWAWQKWRAHVGEQRGVSTLANHKLQSAVTLCSVIRRNRQAVAFRRWCALVHLARQSQHSQRLRSVRRTASCRLLYSVVNRAMFRRRRRAFALWSRGG